MDGSDIHIPTDPDDKDTFYRANNDVKGYNLMHLNALYDIMNRRYIDAVLQDSEYRYDMNEMHDKLDALGVRNELVKGQK